jgi:UPF0716 family protein affecting phage T7 exclusion
MIPERLAPHTFALMRIVFGLMYMSYGLLKLGLLGSPAVDLASLLGAAAVIEAFIGPLIAMGLFTATPGVRCFRRDGCGLFHRAPTARNVAGAEPGHPGGALLFCIPARRRAGRGYLEP